MRRKTKWYLAMGILGVALSVVSLLLGGRISDNVGGMLTGVGDGSYFGVLGFFPSLKCAAGRRRTRANAQG